MPEHIPIPLTIGQWRQAITSFSILYPADRFDWSENVLASTDASPTSDMLSRYRNLVTTESPLSPERDEEQITALNQIALYTIKGRRNGVVRSWVTKEVHQDFHSDVSIDRIQQTAVYTEIAMLDMSLPEIPQLKEAPANIPAAEILKQLGMSEQDSAQVTDAVRRAAHVITSLTTEGSGIRDLFNID